MVEIAPSLSERMRNLARQRPEIRDEFIEMADSLDALAIETPIPKFVGTWTKARRRWCEVTGEPLV